MCSRFSCSKSISKKNKQRWTWKPAMETHWWPVCQLAADSPDCGSQHTHISGTPSLASVQSGWSGSWSGAASRPWSARRSSSGGGCGSRWWQQLERASGRWRSLSWCRRSPSQWGSPELEGKGNGVLEKFKISLNDGGNYKISRQVKWSILTICGLLIFLTQSMDAQLKMSTMNICYIYIF